MFKTVRRFNCNFTAKLIEATKISNSGLSDQDRKSLQENVYKISVLSDR